MSNRVFVTGLGIISAIGINLETVKTAIKNGVTGLGEISWIETENKGFLPVCEVKYSNNDLKEMVNLNTDITISRTTLLGLIAAKEAYTAAQLSDNTLLRTGLISANSVGGMDLSEVFFESFLDSPKKGRLRNIVRHNAGTSSEFIADMLGITDYVTTVSTACSSSANAIMLGTRLIKNNILDRAIVGGCDALTKFTINGFSSLKILDSEECKPFSEDRAGLNLGEGAGYLVLESEKAMVNSGKKAHAQITGHANTCDAFHQTASSPEGDGPYRAMKKALETAGLAPKKIDYINTHGTGTRNNDITEGKAIKRLFSENPPLFSSTKPYTGHTLGAAGGIEAVFSCLAIKENWAYPNLNWHTQMTDLDLKPITELIEDVAIKHVISNSFGFGGNDSSLIFSEC